MIFGITGRTSDAGEYKKNNAVNEIIILITEYEKTNLNINQISAMAVALMGNSCEPDDRGDPENKTGIPYHPGVISTDLEYDGKGTHTLTIHMRVIGRRDVVHRYRKQFVEMMSCAKVHNK